MNNYINKIKTFYEIFKANQTLDSKINFLLGKLYFLRKNYLESKSYLINLNPGEFKGGGTWFPKYNYLANPTEIGMCTLHPGNITHKHGARPVTEGTRYVVVSFIKNADHK